MNEASSGWTPKAERLGIWPCYTEPPDSELRTACQSPLKDAPGQPSASVQSSNHILFASLYFHTSSCTLPGIPDIDVLFDCCWNNASNIVQMFHLPSLILTSSRATGSQSPIFHVPCSFSKPCPRPHFSPNLSTGPTLMPVLWLKEQNPVCFNLKTHRNPRIQTSYMTLVKTTAMYQHHHSIHSCIANSSFLD